MGNGRETEWSEKLNKKKFLTDVWMKKGNHLKNLYFLLTQKSGASVCRRSRRSEAGRCTRGQQGRTQSVPAPVLYKIGTIHLQ